MYQDLDGDRYLFPIEKVFDNAADDLELIAVSKRPMSLLPQKEAVSQSTTIQTKARATGNDLVC